MLQCNPVRPETKPENSKTGLHPADEIAEILLAEALPKLQPCPAGNRTGKIQKQGCIRLMGSRKICWRKLCRELQPCPAGTKAEKLKNRVANREPVARMNNKTRKGSLFTFKHMYNNTYTFFFELYTTQLLQNEKR